jgi:hypothetical protein
VFSVGPAVGGVVVEVGEHVVGLNYSLFMARG